MACIVVDDDFLTSFDRSIELDFGEDPLTDSPSNPTSRKNIHKRLNENNDEIIHTCTTTLNTNPDDLQTRMLRGITYLRQHDYSNALSDFDYCIVQSNSSRPHNISPNDGNRSSSTHVVACLYSRGVCVAGLQRFEEAITDFTECLRLAPDHFNAAFGRAACYNATGFFSKVCLLLPESSSYVPHFLTYFSFQRTKRRLRIIIMRCLARKNYSTRPTPAPPTEGDGACWTWIYAMIQHTTTTRGMSYFVHAYHPHPHHCQFYHRH